MMFKSVSFTVICWHVLNVVCGELTERPENVVGVVGSNVMLRCAGSNLKWEEYISDPNGPTTISTKEDNYVPNKYDLIMTPSGRYNLTIKNLTLTDAGRYRCKIIRGDSAYAEVIVFNGPTPTCTSNSTNNEAVEGDYIRYSCEMKYWGKWAPVMTWKDGSKQVVQAKDDSNVDTAKFSIVVEMESSHNEQSFTCQTYFDKPVSGSLPQDTADNTPINSHPYTELYTSPKLTVYYGPQSLEVKVNGRVHTPGENILPGEVLTITASSNPATRNYTWKNTTSNEILTTGDSITVTVDMLGSQFLKAVVCNNIPIPSAHAVCSESPVNIVVISNPGHSKGNDDGAKAGLGTGVIVAIALGALAFLVIVILIYIFVIRNRKRKAQDEPYAMHTDSNRRKPVPVDQVRIPDVLSPPYGRHDGLNETIPPPSRSPEDIMYADLEMMRDNQADLAIDDVPRSRKPLQVFEPGSGVEYASIQPNRKKDRMQ